MVPPSRALAILSLFLLSLDCVTTRGEESIEGKICILNEDAALVMTIPASRLMMLIPKDRAALVPKEHSGGSDSPSYFYLADDDKGIIASGWFEPASKFPTAKKVWEEDTKAWKKNGLPDPTNVSFQHIDRWDAVVYDVPAPGGSNTHIRAHWVQAGSWIDLHLSMTSSCPVKECRSVLMAIIKSVRVGEKK